MDELYSLENAQKFNWSSVNGNLNPERVSHLEKYLIGKKILDAGCGGGAYVEFLAQKGLEITGVDKYTQFLQLAKEEGRIGTYVQEDITSLPFPDKAFECTYCFDVLEHVNDMLAIQELARVTTKRLIIAVPKEDEIMNKFNLTFLHYQDKTHLRNYTESSLRKLLSGIDCCNIRIFPELAIPTRNLVRQVIQLDVDSFTKKYMKSSLAKIKLKQIVGFGASKSQSLYQEFYDFLTNELLDKASYQDIPTGLVAVVDLASL
ncbi:MULTISPECIES: bifunctional 2-polyprenyl-6-hydroxyphenol methylase/3-demethylubiquinol 3-O-methyltransferase UbiG [Trichocoleus]|uniref:Class I SAM-dependent methyltransferase n=1 Tax=Trichocoleus desertorum GB2-A4 TaxID=2933944 RepID=A0ABV0J7A1_9CYAN|nr:class I SAM-dependent methyltransferase [Trichocoleus sp. FACHB-46]MBD1862629.1 class I SAM-dependent methyltransferase [Trichocoleus sp. FACHB-46]